MEFVYILLALGVFGLLMAMVMIIKACRYEDPRALLFLLAAIAFFAFGCTIIYQSLIRFDSITNLKPGIPTGQK